MILAGELASDEAVRRFKFEAETAAKLEHPNILPVYEIGENDGFHFFSMRLLLRARPASALNLQREATTSEQRRVAALLAKAARAVSFAHSRGVLHRDLKPANILVNHEAKPFVADFGIAKSTLEDDAGLTATHSVIGSPHYVAPEQARGDTDAISTATDIYGLGAILYELLTGHPPFAGGNPMAVMRQVRQKPVRAPREIDPTIHSDLEVICLRCLEKNPDDRLASAREVAEELERFVRSEPIASRPLPAVHRLWRWTHRNPLLSATLLTLSLLLMGFVTYIFLTSVELRKQREESALFHYMASMNLVQSDREEGNMDRLQQLLDVTRDFPHRGFEWYYWDNLVNQDHLTFRGHTGQVNGVAFSSDGRRLATAGDKTGRVWDRDSGEVLAILKGHTKEVLDVTFAMADRYVITVSKDHTARVYDSESGDELRRLRATGELWSIAAVKDTDRVIAGESGHAWIWNIESGALIKKIPMADGWSRRLAVSPNGRHFVTGGRPPKLWDLATSSHVLDFEADFDQAFVAISANQSRMLGAGEVFDSSSGRLVWSDPAAFHMAAVAIAPLGERIAVGGQKNDILVWDETKDRQSSILQIHGHGRRVSDLAFSPDGDWLVSGSHDRTAKLWPIGQMNSGLLLGHTDTIKSVSFSPDGQRLLSAGNDKTVRVWRLQDETEERILTGHSGNVNTAIFLPDGRRILTASNDGTAKIWDVSSGKVLVNIDGHEGDLWCANLSNDGSRIITGSVDLTAKVWDAVTGEELLTLAGHTKELTAVAFSPDNKRILTTSDDETAKIWDAETGREILTFTSHTGWIGGAVFLPDGKRVITSGNDDVARLWDSHSGEELRVFRGHQDTVQTVALTPDGSRLLTASDDSTVRLWHIETGRELLRFEKHSDYVWTGAISPNGEIIATAGDDKVVRIWHGAVD